MSSRSRRSLRPTFIFALFVLVVAFSPLAFALAQTGNWVVGDTVNLQKGALIREGPGLSYRAHTCVPVDDWAVKVTGGPRYADGKTWFDTSRKAAGDPSGGTGWVDQSQADRLDPCPANLPGNSDIQPPPGDGGGEKDKDNPLDQLRRWWDGQPLTGRVVVLVLAVILLLWTWRQVSGTIMGLVRALLLGVILWWVADQTRSSWAPQWAKIAQPNWPDAAFLLGCVPVASWLINRLRGRA